MSLRKRSAIPVCVVLAAAAFAVPATAQSLHGVDQEARAARRDEARTIVVQQIQETLVRDVDAKVVVRDAHRIVREMSDAQIDAVLEGENYRAVTQATAVRQALAEGETGVRSLNEAAVGDAKSDLLYVPLPPCRAIDTRFSGGGKLQPTVVRDFRIVGTTGFEAQGGKAGGCGVPAGATQAIAAAVMINIVAVEPEGGGNIRAWEFNTPMPNASSINFQRLNPLMNIANGIIVPISGVASLAADLSVMGSVNRVHFIADVSGYFTRFPIEDFQYNLKSSLLTQDFTTLIDLNDGACHELNSCTVTAEADGTVIVEAWGQFVASHTAGTLDRVAIGVETANPVACTDSDTVNASDFEVPASLGSNPDVDFTVSHGRAFAQAGGTTRTYRLSGKMLSGANTGDKIENSRLICTFIPN